MIPSPINSGDPFEAFRRHISQQAHRAPKQWDASRALLEKSRFPSTVDRLVCAIKERPLPDSVKALLLQSFEERRPQRVQDLDGEHLKRATGLPPAKAMRALAIVFGLVPAPTSKWPVTCLSSEAMEQLVRGLVNPFELLTHADVASVLDIGAGDLSFAEELADQYGPLLLQRNRQLILHGVDRLDPHSRLGGPLHADPGRLCRLQQKQGLSFAFFGRQDIFDLSDLDGQDLLAPRYTVATCWAPATPTFAYEPSRLSPAVIHKELQRTKGTFHLTRFGKESALEVQHGTRALLFPPWKFDIIGPLALLHLLAQRSSLCLLGSVDDQVFWEILAQLLDDPRYRPQGEPFHAANLPTIFGGIYDQLTDLPIGTSVDLADLGILRRQLPSADHSTGLFRYVRVSRGATFPGMPASSTARKFSAMTEEVPPWMVTLVPA
ncbi:MAG: hypothetical protein JSR29_05200 [Nitrospira sp.]|nr:hypothetical protein [Nitrospira sp.]